MTPTDFSGLWLPLVTPFHDGAVDTDSWVRLVRHYAAQPLAGLIAAGTTGESATLDGAETERLVHLAAEALEGRMPLLLGLSGSDTRKGVADMERTAGWPVQGYLVTCPAFTRPPQDGLLRHYQALADAAAHPVLAYNIPYRTGVSMTPETLLRLARHPNMAGVKDCSADPVQTQALCQGRPDGFAVLSGEDGQYLGALALGSDGGILASAHMAPGAFAELTRLMRAGALEPARALWRRLSALPPLLFAEPNPAPIKHWLWRDGLIRSPEVRLPLMPVSAGLAARLDAARLAQSQEPETATEAITPAARQR